MDHLHKTNDKISQESSESEKEANIDDFMKQLAQLLIDQALLNLKEAEKGSS